MAYKNYHEFIKEKRTWYKAVGKSFCLILKEDVFFTSKGFQHLLYDGLGHARSRKERMYRVGLLPLVIPVLKSATKIEDYKSPTFSKPLAKMVEFWTLQSVVGKRKILVTVILRKVGTGKIHFYSVWKRKEKKTKKPSRWRFLCCAHFRLMEFLSRTKLALHGHMRSISKWVAKVKFFWG